MAKAFVYSILAAVIFTVHSTTAYKLTVHVKMTKAERLAVFGSKDSVPKYEVFPMSLTGMTRNQQASRNIRCTLSLNGEEIKLNLKPTAQYLATKYIPVWSANSDRHAYKQIRYTPLPTAMRLVGNFTMYHDWKNKAALVVYTDRSEKIVIEGMIGSRYTIRSLPRRLIGKLPNVVHNLSKLHNVMGGTITSKKDLGYYAVITNPEALAQGVHDKSLPEYTGAHTLSEGTTDKPELLNKNIIAPKAIYPKILIVLDHNAVRHRTITQALRFTLAYWNGVNVIFREFYKPKIHLNIAGIVIAKDSMATPYITHDTSVPSIDELFSILSEMQSYFYEERIRLPIKQYDIIVAMTSMTLCPGTNVSCPDSKFYPVFINDMACHSQSYITNTETVTNTMITYYDATFGPAHILSFADDARHIFVPLMKRACVLSHGNMTADNQNLTPAECIQTVYSQRLADKHVKCFLNKPLPIKSVDEVLPGRWLSMDGQCQNEGYAKSCKLKKKIGKCMMKGCRAEEGSRECIESQKRPLPGSKCGTYEYCNKSKKCVKNDRRT